MSKTADLDIDRLENGGTVNEYDAESQNDRDAEERAIELKSIEKEDSATEQFLEDQRLND